MDGVTILQVIETTSRPEWAIGVAVICAFAGFLFAIGAIAAFSVYDTKAGILCLSIAVICLLILIILLTTIPKIPETTYRVLVDDTVNMNEFFQTYELIRQEGLIYVVKLIN